ncbi:helix-turn-helix domain-containing protein [uncultured Dysosmobacter sp.]|uniref:helix-turn-helix domain-containing protein n=1 Tax=uncultured Dysosmobacter sp. TaxID=2591384 RepID=UPI002602D378|nr:helix-turn-helix transcriptional regulator [uncultured Dysosmobacter sp.]
MKAFSYHGQRNVSGERIRQARTRQRCTQADLAARIQVSGVILERDCISKIENGLRMVQDFELRAVAKALGVTTDWLVGEEDDE